VNVLPEAALQTHKCNADFIAAHPSLFQVVEYMPNKWRVTRADVVARANNNTNEKNTINNPTPSSPASTSNQPSSSTDDGSTATTTHGSPSAPTATSPFHFIREDATPFEIANW